MLELLNQGKDLEQEPEMELNTTCPCDGCYVAPCGCTGELKLK